MIRTAVFAIPPRCDGSRGNRRPAWLDLGPVTTLIFIGGARYAASAAEAGRPPSPSEPPALPCAAVILDILTVFSRWSSFLSMPGGSYLWWPFYSNGEIFRPVRL